MVRQGRGRLALGQLRRPWLWDPEPDVTLGPSRPGLQDASRDQAWTQRPAGAACAASDTHSPRHTHTHAQEGTTPITERRKQVPPPVKHLPSFQGPLWRVE